MLSAITVRSEVWHSHVLLQLVLYYAYFIDLEMQWGFYHVVNYDVSVMQNIYSVLHYIFNNYSVSFLIQQMPFSFHLGNKDILFFLNQFIIIIIF